jgi:hypothetical protein
VADAKLRKPPAREKARRLENKSRGRGVSVARCIVEKGYATGRKASREDSSPDKLLDSSMLL